MLALTDADDDADARTWLRRTGARLAALAVSSAERVARGDISLGEVGLRNDRKQYLGLIAACHEAIKKARLTRCA